VTQKIGLILASTDTRPRLEIIYPKTPQKEQHAEEYIVEEMVDIRGWRAQGNKMANDKFKDIRWLEPLPEPVEETPEPEALEDVATEEDNENEVPDDETNGSSENAVSITENDEPEDNPDASEEDAKGDQKTKKDNKKGPDSKSQLGLFE